MSQNNAVCLITGPSGSGKTSLLTTAAEYLWETYKLSLRLATADGGGWGSRVQAYINKGLIQAWRVRSRWSGDNAGLVEETLALASQGYWPSEMVDVQNGESKPGCKLIPPSTLIRVFTCSKGHLLLRTEGALTPTECVSCGTMVPLQSGIITTEHAPSPGFDKVGGYAFEGITSFSDIQLQSLSDRRAKNELRGENSSIGGFASGTIKFDGNNRADYGFAQTQAPRWLNFSSTIPGLKIPPIWTGLETVIDDGGTSMPYWAPAIAGQAKSGMVPQWVGNYLGTSWVEGPAKDGKVQRVWRLHTTPYVGQDDKAHIYKTRAADAGLIPPILSDAEGNPPFSGFSLKVFFKLLSQATTKTEEEVDSKFPDAPGLPPAMLEVPKLVPMVALPPQKGQPLTTMAAAQAGTLPAVMQPASSPIAAGQQQTQQQQKKKHVVISK